MDSIYANKDKLLNDLKDQFDVNCFDFENLDEEPWLLRDKGIGNGNIATYAHGEEHLQSKNASCSTSIRPAMYISTSYFDK